MEKTFWYSFDDEPVIKFCYYTKEKRIELHFAGFYDLKMNPHFIDKNCVFIIENWKEGKSKIGDDQYYNLEKNMGILNMVLFMELKGKDLEMLVSTVDNRYITLFFKEPSLSLK
jgi:hypothetical protein